MLLKYKNKTMQRNVVTEALGWTSDRLKAALLALDHSLAGTGLILFRHEYTIGLVPTDTALIDAANTTITVTKQIKHGMDITPARTLKKILNSGAHTGRVSRATGISVNHLRKTGVVLASIEDRQVRTSPALLFALGHDPER